MAIIRVKNKYQVTIPTRLREQAGLHIGDVLEAAIQKGKITLTPKTIIDRAVAEGLEDVKNGRVYGPFVSAAPLIRSLSSPAPAKGRTRSKHA